MDDLLAQWAGEISVAVALIIFMWQERKSRHQLETQQLEVDKQQNTHRADEQKRADKRDDKMVDLYAAMVEQQKAMTGQTAKLTDAIKGLALYEQQNQRLLEKNTELLQSIVGLSQGNQTSLQTLTGSMDSVVASLGRIEQSLDNGNADHKAIAQALIGLKSAVGRVEAKLPTPPPTTPASKPAIEVAAFKPKTKSDDDEQEKRIA